LLAAMKAGSDSRNDMVRKYEDYIVPITARYKDFDGNVYESTAELRYSPVRSELSFGPTKQRSIDPATDARQHERRVLDFLKSKPMPRLVENVASAVGLGFHEADKILKNLYSKDMVYRDTIDADGDYVYWYRGPTN
jgi:hypothetical protein